MLTYASRILNQNLMLICLPCFQAICNPTSNGLFTGHVNCPLQNHCLKYTEPIGIQIPLANALQLPAHRLQEPTPHSPLWVVITTRWHCGEVP